MANKYYIGDLHLGHENMAVKRGFKDALEMFEYIKVRWNKKVKKQDVVYLLGDISMENSKYYYLLDELLGSKVVILGNHDMPKDAQKLLKYCTKIAGVVNYKSVFFTHVPVHPMEFKDRISKNVHAHTHEKSVKRNIFWKDSRYICVSCEQVDYTPMSLSELNFKTLR